MSHHYIIGTAGLGLGRLFCLFQVEKGDKWQLIGKCDLRQNSGGFKVLGGMMGNGVR